MKIRPATQEDVDAVRAVGHRTWPPTYEPLTGTQYVADGLVKYWSRAAVERLVSETVVLVAEDDDGHVTGMGNLDRAPAVPVIRRLYVLPEAHGTGTGAALMEGLVAAARECAGAVRLEYVDGNARAARFYRKQGFAPLQDPPPATPGHPATVWMERRFD